MSRFRVTLLAVALVTVASVTAVPSYAESGNKPDGKRENAKREQQKPACTPSELAAFVAAAKTRAAAEEAEADEDEDRKAPKQRGKAGKHLSADRSPTSKDADDEADDDEADLAEDASVKAEKAKERAAKQKTRALEKVARACAMTKYENAKTARKEAEKKARARKFQAIGVVASHDADAGTVTVFIKAGSPDLHKRKLAIKVTAETLVKLDGEKTGLAGLVSGTFVSVHGVRTGDALVAARINAASPEVAEDAVPATSPVAAPAPVSGD